MADKDFVIENGVLKKYKGPGGDVVIPDSVTEIGYSAFEGCTSLTSITIPDRVTEIGRSAFYGCRGLTSITIPDSVTEIGWGAFSGCTSLTSITIPDSVTSIGNYAFYNCSGLTSITIPDSVTSIGDSAFRGCTSLTSITIPDSVTEIGKEAFEYCERLTSITIPDSVTEIGRGAFYGCKNLTSITIPDSVRAIGEYVFSGCTSLTSITIPDSVTRIESDTFYGCTSLTSITIPDSVTRIGNHAFSGCTSLTSITIPNSVTEIGSYAFRGIGTVYNYRKAYRKATGDHWGAKCLNGLVEGPLVYTDASKSHLVFCSTNATGEIFIPDGVTRIERDAFEFCTSLTSITVPDSVTKIGDSAFRGCTSLTSVTILDGVTMIGDNAFSGCTSLTSITIPDSVTKIGDYAFEDCKKLRSITIPEGVVRIGNYSFRNCTNLQEITFRGSSIDCDECSFSGCTKLKTFHLPDSLVFTKDIFPYHFSAGGPDFIRGMYMHLSDSVLKTQVLQESVFNKLPEDLLCEIFVRRMTKPLLKHLMTFASDELLNLCADALLKTTEKELSVKECNRIANVIVMCVNHVEDALLQSLYAALKMQKKGKKACETIEADSVLLKRVSTEKSTKKLSEAEQLENDLLMADGMTVTQCVANFKEYYGIEPSYTAKMKDGKNCPKALFAWLLMAHETIRQFYSSPEVVSGYPAGIRPEAQKVIDLLDHDSFMKALREIAMQNLGLIGHSKKMYLAYPICRYADEELMQELTSKAPSWASGVSGKYAPPLHTFRCANMYSSTKASMYFAERYKELERYAELHGTTADDIRETVFADFGIDKDGKVYYDLGSVTVEAQLTQDLDFIVWNPATQKTSKTLPKKDADEKKYKKASAEFSNLKKKIRANAKDRQNRLLDAYMNAKPFKPESLLEVYPENPILFRMARLLVWTQNGKTFTYGQDGWIDVQGNPYAISKTDKIVLAHPMEMDKTELSAWQAYFSNNNLKQPFAQVWEPVRDLENISNNRYTGCKVVLSELKGKENCGIYLYLDQEFSFRAMESFCSSINIRMSGCTMEWHLADGIQKKEATLQSAIEIDGFHVHKNSRCANFIVSFLDAITVKGRIANDDVSIKDQLDGCTAAQIDDYLKVATENNATNCTALLLNYKNEHFSHINFLDSFTLDF